MTKAVNTLCPAWKLQKCSYTKTEIEAAAWSLIDAFSCRSNRQHPRSAHRASELRVKSAALFKRRPASLQPHSLGLQTSRGLLRTAAARKPWQLLQRARQRRLQRQRRYTWLGRRRQMLSSRALSACPTQLPACHSWQGAASRARQLAQKA